MKTIPNSDDWTLKDPEQTPNLLPQMAGVFTVNGKKYYCSLILLLTLEKPVLEFMAFQWNAHENKVTNWMDVYCQRRDFAPNLTCSDVDVATFRSCIKDFFNFLAEKEEKEHDD